MTDEEMTKLCAEAMGLSTWLDARGILCLHDSMCSEYEPLYDDWQAMALLKKFPKQVTEAVFWAYQRRNFDFNRVIVECVAKMQASKRTEAV